MTATPERFDETRTIITREPAYITHNFGKPIPNPRPAKGINQLLLDDGTTVFECAEADYTSEEIERVVRHRSKHTTGKSKYAPEVIAQVMECWWAERANGIRGVNERTAIKLNAQRIKTVSGGKWYASTVAALAQGHKADYPAPDPAANGHDPFKAVDAIMAERADRAPAPAPAPELTRAVVFGSVEEVAGRISELLDCLVAMAQTPCPHDDYDTLKAKAGAFDQMRTFMGQGIDA